MKLFNLFNLDDNKRKKLGLLPKCTLEIDKNPFHSICSPTQTKQTLRNMFVTKQINQFGWRTKNLPNRSRDETWH
jgi:hypothetical protein